MACRIKSNAIVGGLHTIPPLAHQGWVADSDTPVDGRRLLGDWFVSSVESSDGFRSPGFMAPVFRNCAAEPQCDAPGYCYVKAPFTFSPRMSAGALVGTTPSGPCGGVGAVIGGSASSSGITAVDFAVCAGNAVNLGLMNTNMPWGNNGLPCQSFGSRSWGATPCVAGHPVPPADGILICVPGQGPGECGPGDCNNLCGDYALTTSWIFQYSNWPAVIQIQGFLAHRRMQEEECSSCFNVSREFFFHQGPTPGTDTPNGIYPNQLPNGGQDWNWFGGTMNVDLQYEI